MQTKELYQVVLNNLSEGIYMVDAEKNMLLWNETAEKITGYTEEDMLAQTFEDGFLDQFTQVGPVSKKETSPILATLTDGMQRSCDLFLRHKNGYRVPVCMKIVPTITDGDIMGVIAMFTDKSIRVQQADLISSLSKLAQLDQLTGLFNRKNTEAMLSRQLDEFKRNGKPFSVMYINLDDFSCCNKEYGFESGNDLLVRLAENFKHSLRDSDFVGRMEGEEFLGIFTTDSLQQLRLLSEKMRRLVASTKITIEQEEVGVTASIGATMANTEDTPQTLLDRAVSLMHVSKISGKNCSIIG